LASLGLHCRLGHESVTLWLPSRPYSPPAERIDDRNSEINFLRLPPERSTEFLRSSGASRFCQALRSKIGAENINTILDGMILLVSTGMTRNKSAYTDYDSNLPSSS